MPISVACLLAASTPKAGNQPEECEDRWAAAADGLSFAVADGASEASFAGLWASILAQRFVEDPARALEPPWLLAARQAFMQQLDLPRLPWHALEKLRRGSHAALAGVVIDPAAESFEVFAWGDACVAWVHGEVASCFPFSEVADLPERPYLISTVPEQNEAAPGRQGTSRQVPLEPGHTDVFLMTDAVAGWFLAEWAAGRQPWRELLALPDAAALTTWAEGARSQKALRNDDVAVISLRLSHGNDAGGG
ncbi:MAG: protein phosphatase 2C domain-containing protein [Candidatus Sericytochromatia bacterium]|nr:protein phosphatase 2C domain-containing protein [Candidatus Sericytochromatia bacterium]